MSDCIAPECWNTLGLSRLRCWNIGGGFFLLYSEKKVTLGKNGKLLPRGGKVTFSKNVTTNVTANVTAKNQ